MPRIPEFHVPPPGEIFAHTWVVVADVVISATQPGETSIERWAEYCDALAAPAMTALVGVAFGNISLNSVQRKMAADAVKRKQVTAILDSRVGRGVVTAVRWLGVNIQAFAWSEIDDALARVETRELSPAQLRANLAELLANSGAPSLTEVVGPSYSRSVRK